MISNKTIRNSLGVIQINKKKLKEKMMEVAWLCHKKATINDNKAGNVIDN